MTAEGPAAALRLLCTEAADGLRSPELRTTLRGIAAHLDLPLQLAVAGAVSAGKSTLINAMLGRTVAHADAGECTRLVTWFEYGEDDGEVLVERTAGPPVALRLDAAGRIPDDLGVATADVLRLRVRLTAPLLRSMTLIDTPGVNTVTAANEEATRRLLFGDAAAAHAQALVYVLRFVQRFDADLLAEFRDLSAATGLNAVNTAVVLSNIDRRGSGDPWPTARQLAARATQALRGVALDVVPMIGLVAETARARRLGPAEVAGLHALAALPTDDVAEALIDLSDFIEFGVPGAGAELPSEVRAGLVALLHRYGIDAALRRIRARPDEPAEVLQRALTVASGFTTPPGVPPDPARPTLVDVLERFARHADRLKALAAMTRLRAAIRDDPVDPRDRGIVADLLAAVDENRPIAAGLRELRVMAAVAAYGHGTLRVDDETADALMHLARGATPAEQLGLPAGADAAAVRDAAVGASRRWRSAAQLAGPTVAGHRLRDVLAAVEDIADDHTAAVEGPPFVPIVHDERIDRLLASAFLSEADRGAVAALTTASDVRGAVRLAEDATEQEVAAVATEFATRFRLLQHRPLRGAERRAVEAVCDAFEKIVIDVRARAGAAG